MGAGVGVEGGRFHAGEGVEGYGGGGDEGV